MTEREPGRKRGGGGIGHARAKVLFSMAWDGELSAPRLEALHEHLRGCSKCRRATARMAVFLEKLDAAFRRRTPGG